MEINKRCPNCGGFPLKVDSPKSWLTIFILATFWALFCIWILRREFSLLILISGSVVSLIGLYNAYRYFFVKKLHAKCEECKSRWLYP